MYYKHIPNNVYHNREITLQNEAGFYLEAEETRNEKKSTCYVTDVAGQANQIFKYTDQDMLESVISGLFLEIAQEKHNEAATLQMCVEKHPKDEKRRRDLEKKLIALGKYVPNKVSLEHTKDHQKWSFHNGYVVSKLHGLVLGTEGHVSRGSAPCVTFPHGKANQKWHIKFAGKDAHLQEKYDEAVSNLPVNVPFTNDPIVFIPKVEQIEVIPQDIPQPFKPLDFQGPVQNSDPNFGGNINNPNMVFIPPIPHMEFPDVGFSEYPNQNPSIQPSFQQNFFQPPPQNYQ
jgi:hypothetical protein